VTLYCTVYLVMPISADGLGIVFGCLTNNIKIERKETDRQTDGRTLRIANAASKDDADD